MPVPDASLPATGESSWENIAGQAIDWYWTAGKDRKGQYAISPVWLDDVYDKRDSLAAMRESRARRRLSVGLWGPSASGKSTLISLFVDRNAKEGFGGGALDWGVPTLFSSRAAVPNDVVIFNPHNMGSDASGCVSRFVLREEGEVATREHPVQILLLSPAQIMHALAAGYVSECRGGDDRRWTVEDVEKMLSGKPLPGAQAVNREAFARLHDLVCVLDLLVYAEQPRFSGLNAGGKWLRALRSRILQTPSLAYSEEAVLSLAAELLWDGKERLTALYKDLVRFRDQPVFREKPLYCSMAVAAALVNIDSYHVIARPDRYDLSRGAPRRIRETVAGLSWEDRGGQRLIGVGLANRLLAGDQQFGLLQGVVRELVIPLRRSALSTSDTGFVQFMEKADLVDFPGVALKDTNVQASRLDVDGMEGRDESRLLTEVLKRGKTASMVDGYGRTLGLDAFVLLVRAGHFPAKPQQLHGGLTTWWRFFEPSYDVYQKPPGKPPLPLFLDMTFFGSVVDKVIEGAATAGLEPLVQMIAQLDPLVAPDVCTLLATTYPQFTEGRIHIADKAAIKKAIDEITSDLSFGVRCRSEISRTSLERMASTEDGGVEYLFEVLAGSLRAEVKQHLLDRRANEDRRRLCALMTEQAPSDDAGAKRRQDLETVIKAIEQALVEKQSDPTVRDSAAWVGVRMRRLLDVSPESLDPLPFDAEKQKLGPYVEKQVKNWIDSKRSLQGLEELGLGEWGIRGRIVGYMAECIEQRVVVKWIRDELGGMSSAADAKEARRALAICLANAITRDGGKEAETKMQRPLDGEDGVIALVRKWAEVEEEASGEGLASYEDSPHFSAAVKPVLTLFAALAEGRGTARPTQAGDPEIQNLLKEALTALGAA
jgi:hypothetical protein